MEPRLAVLLSLLSAPAAALLTASWQALPPGAEQAWRGSSPPRSGPTAAADSDGNTWLFGGYAEPEGKERAVVNDLLRYSASGGWEQLQEPIRTTIGKTQRVRSNRPGPRLASASAILDGELLVFGGWDPQVAGTGGIILDDVWALDLGKQTWQRCEAPMPRGPTSRHVACNVGGKVVVHTFRCKEAVMVWDPSTRALVEQPTKGTPPSSRGLHVAAAADERTLVVFGGAAQDGTMVNDAFALDTVTWEWRVLASNGDRPSPRAGACAAPLPNGERGILVCCGAEASANGLVPRADVWALTLDDQGGGEWSKLLDDAAPDAPGPRNAATLTPLSDGAAGEGGSGGSLLLHGGWRPFVSTYGDTYVLKVQSSS